MISNSPPTSPESWPSPTSMPPERASLSSPASPIPSNTEASASPIPLNTEASASPIPLNTEASSDSRNNGSPVTQLVNELDRSISSEEEDIEETESRPSKRRRLEATENEVEAGGQIQEDNSNNEDSGKTISSNVCKHCRKKFANPHNRERHEMRIHEGHQPETTQPKSPVVFSPRITRRNNPSRKRPTGQIFDFENDANARRLRDKSMKEIREKFAARNKKAEEERRKKALERQKILDEKNRLAEQNERRRQEEETAAREKSERAIANLIKSRKRRR